VRVDPLLELPLRAGALLGPVELELAAAPAVAGGRRRHDNGAENLWSRGALQLTVALGVSLPLGGGNRAVPGE
jgi:hypothetical protein